MLEESSPCKNCENHLNGIDKRLCLGSCKRLAAYQEGKDWTKEEMYIVTKGKDLVEDIENSELDTVFTDTDNTNDIDVEFEEEPDDESEETETDPEELPGPVKRIQPETSWKKTINPKTTKGGRKKCAICGKPEGHENKFLRGVCRKPCYNQWYSGKVEHQLLGKFKTATKKEVLSMETKIGSTKKSLDKATPEMNSSPMTTIDNICPTTININLEPYPQIMELIDRMAVDLSLPVTHIVITLLAEALAERRRER